MSVLLTFAPLLIGIILAVVWLILVFVVGIAWSVGQFKLGRTVSGIVLLLLLILLPVGTGLLWHGFFGSKLFAVEEGQKPSTTLNKISFVLESMENLAGGEKAPDGEPASSDAANAPQADGRAPEDYTDEELLALAEESFDDMFSMEIGYMNGGPLPTDYEDVIRIESRNPDGSTYTWAYLRVPGYETLEEAKTAAAEVWYAKYARKYELDIGAHYVYFNGGVYTPDGAMGGTAAPFFVDGIVSREDDEVVFAGHWEVDGEFHGDTGFSLVFEDGRWKYGRYLGSMQ